MRVLVACEFSGIVREAFRKRGHDAWSCDILPTEIPGPHFQQGIHEVLRNSFANGEKWDLMIAHPPCTYLTCAGNKWFKPEFAGRFPERETNRRLAMHFFLELATYPHIPRIAVENPIGVMSTKFRRPDQIIHPYDFGIPIMKATCLWLKNLPPLMLGVKTVPEVDRFTSGNIQSKWHTETGHIKDRQERMKARSRTFPQIAEAMASQWG